jgi:hypothetical protein
MSDLVKQLRSIDHMSVEDCFLQSYLYTKAADRIEELEAMLHLAYRAGVEDVCRCKTYEPDCYQGQEVIAIRERAEAAEAMLPRAYRAGVEAGAGVIPDGYYNHEEEWGVWAAAQHMIRALPTPTIKQLKEMLEGNGDEAE